MNPDEEAARAFNARTAERYDALPYTPAPEPALDLERVLGVASLYGCGPEGAPDVLDLGCGTGVQLERLAGQTKGRLVGTDISPAACAEADRRLGGRGRVVAGDLLDLEPEALGRFDVVYCVGVIYVVPEPVRRRALDLIARCLKPGGVLVVSYYAGGLGMMRAELNRMIRAAAGEDLKAARGFLNEVAGRFQRGDPGLPGQTAQLTAAYTDDPTLRHEVLCEAMTALHTSALQAELEGQGLGFLTYLHGLPWAAAAPAARRAVAADVFDFMWGGYRYGLFGKSPAGEGPPDAARARGWRTAVRRESPPGLQGEARFRDPNGGTLTAVLPVVQAALDRLAEGEAGREALHAAARERLAAADLPAPPPAVLDAELGKLWAGGWVQPLWRG